MSVLPERNPTQESTLLPPSTFEECSIRDGYVILERSDGTKRYLPFNRIMYCEVRRRCFSIHTVTGKVYSVHTDDEEEAANLARKITTKLSKIPPSPYTVSHATPPGH